MAQTLTVEGMLRSIPVRMVPFETREEDRVTLLRPKFVSPWLAWMQNFLSKPVFRVKLDELGSFIWMHADGQATVAELCERLQARFGARVEPVQERALTFIYQMLEGRFLTLNDPTRESSKLETVADPGLG